LFLQRCRSAGARIKNEMLDEKIDLSGPFATALFAEYQNNFYYEIEGVDHIPYVFLKTSFLHEGKFDRELVY